MGKLIKCKDCGQEISKKAKQCPHCGAPVKARTSGCAWLMLGLIVLVVIIAIFSTQNHQPSRPQQQTVRPSPTPTANFAPLEKIAGYQIPSKNKMVLDRYKEISQIAQKVYGWFIVDCTTSLCGDGGGFLVAFRITTDVGEILPIWHVSEDLISISWVNGKAKGETPALPQKGVPDISAVADHFKGLPESSAIVLRQKNTP